MYIFILDEMKITFCFIDTISKSNVYVWIYWINQINQTTNFSTETIIILGICIITCICILNLYLIVLVFDMYLNWTCSISYGVNLYLDLQNVNKFKFK
jgi:hypothetical protein